MIETILRQYLVEKTEKKVLIEEPGVIPSGDFILLERTSGSEKDQIESAVIRCRCFSDRMVNAAKLEKTVRGFMKDSVKLRQISSCKVNQIYNYTDTAAKRYCYQCIYDVVFFDED